MELQEKHDVDVASSVSKTDDVFLSILLSCGFQLLADRSNNSEDNAAESITNRLSVKGHG